LGASRVGFTNEPWLLPEPDPHEERPTSLLDMIVSAPKTRIDGGNRKPKAD